MFSTFQAHTKTFKEAGEVDGGITLQTVMHQTWVLLGLGLEDIKETYNMQCHC